MPLKVLHHIFKGFKEMSGIDQDHRFRTQRDKDRAKGKEEED